MQSTDISAAPAGTIVIGAIAASHRATTRQVVLAWLLARSPAILPIPGTGSVAHLEANVAAAELRLNPDELS